MAEKLLEIKDLSISFGEGTKISQLKMPTLISIKVKLSPL
jgi:hypothetical protein